MKQTISIICLLLAMTMTITAQNSFKGIVKYKVESSGDVAFQVPAEAATAELKINGNDLATKSAIFLGSPVVEQIIINNLTVISCVNYSQLLDYLRSNGSEFTYQGNGKLIMKQIHTEADGDSLTIPDTEAGHYYFEYVAGETSQIAGITAKKVIMHTYDDEGIDQPIEMWYSDEMGPRYNFLMMGLHGVPLMYKQPLGDGRAITLTATEVVKGKVKEADFLIPMGYEQLSDEEINTLGTEIQEELELLNE